MNTQYLASVCLFLSTTAEKRSMNEREQLIWDYGAWEGELAQRRRDEHWAVDDRSLHLHNDFSRSNRIFACTQLEFQRWMSTIYNSHMYFVKQTFWVIFVFVFVVPLLFAVPYLFLIQWVWMSMDVYIWMKIMVVYSTVSAALLYAFDIQLVTILWNFCTTSMI